MNYLKSYNPCDYCPNSGCSTKPLCDCCDYHRLLSKPTADVVPKSEYEELKQLLDATIAGQETLQKALANAKIEVAREIFAEIKKAIKEETLDYCNGFEKAETLELQEYFKTKQNTAIFLYMKIDNLEKKYTEGEE